MRLNTTAFLCRVSSLFACAAAAAAAWAAPGSSDPLADGFANPPADTRPKTCWFWMNGNVTRDGITRDLEAMHRAGIGGVMIFDGGTYLPDGPAGFLSPEWRGLMTHALREGSRLGIEVGMHNSPGWSSSGGPWIRPDQSMQQLVWTETTVAGGRRVDLELPHPQTNLGFYRDAAIVAFPALRAETTRYEDAVARITVGDGRAVAKEILSDGRTDTGVSLGRKDRLEIEFAEAVDLCGLSAQPGASGRLPQMKVDVSVDGRTFTQVCTLSNPRKLGIRAPAVRAFSPMRARFVRLVSSGDGDLGELVCHRAPRIADWPAKANFDYRVTGQLALPAPIPAEAAIDPRTVIDLTSHVREGRLAWDAPAGAWTILRVGHTPTGQENVAASAAGRGLECDKFSAAAADHHFSHVIKQVMADAAAAGVKGPAMVEIDSYEAGMQNWTAAFPEEFLKRAGYDLRPYLPALTGRVVGDAGISERFLFDFRRVQADLMAENYYGRMASLVRASGLKFYVEGYGPGNFDELRVCGIPDVPMTEFWTRTPWTPNRTVKMVTSAAHVYGRPVVAAEAFTGEAQTSRWLEYPYALKALGDEMFAHGVNQFVFHRFAHQPHPDAAPGMAMGPYGAFIERTNTWFEQSRGWMSYLARSQFLLRQGTYAADVLYFAGERAPDPTQYAIPVLPPGYTYDVVNADVLLNRLQVRDGEYVLPEGGRYRLLVLPGGLKAMRPALLHRLREFVGQGAALLGPKPVFSPTLAGFPSSEEAMLHEAGELWSPARTGPGRVFTERTIGMVLAELGVAPDFSFHGALADASLSWEHRRLADGDLFFVANRQRRSEEIAASFRGMAGREPEIWQPESGERQAAAVHGTDGGRAIVPLRLEPAGSLFVLFRHPASEKAPSVLTRDGQPVVTTAPLPARAPAAAGDFTMAIWVKPDTDLRVMPAESARGRIDEVGKFYAIPADPGDVRFGPGHATAGLAVGRNGIFVVERSTDRCPAVLVANVKVSGWTHVAVVYRGGRPRLYVNGSFIREGLASGMIVHPGVGAPPPPVDYTLHFPAIEALTRAAGEPPPPSRGQVFCFEGNFVPADAFDRPLGDGEVAALAAKGVPDPAIPVVTDLVRLPDGTAEALVWQGGAFALDTGKPVRVDVASPRQVSGPWRVAFQEGRGAPASIEMPVLQSLHLQPDSGVKFFSGTASYTRTVDVPAGFLGAGRRVVLDLGRVEVSAEVYINGSRAGLVWKEPYRLDVTGAVHAGANSLEVRVATLWPNRLIGDEHLPAEDTFGIADERGAEAAGITRLPDWYRLGRPKPPGGRVTFATWRFYDKDEPLLASGLLGPVRLLNPVVLRLPK